MIRPQIPFGRSKESEVLNPFGSYGHVLSMVIMPAFFGTLTGLLAYAGGVPLWMPVAAGMVCVALVGLLARIAVRRAARGGNEHCATWIGRRYMVLLVECGALGLLAAILLVWGVLTGRFPLSRTPLLVLLALCGVTALAVAVHVWNRGRRQYLFFRERTREAPAFAPEQTASCGALLLGQGLWGGSWLWGLILLWSMDPSGAGRIMPFLLLAALVCGCLWAARRVKRSGAGPGMPERDRVQRQSTGMFLAVAVVVAAVRMSIAGADIGWTIWVGVTLSTLLLEALSWRYDYDDRERLGRPTPGPEADKP